uniref:Mitochondrial import inner membrane translocase subunit n=1 Tax=Hemiselmis andersenii TaxID=464988 RepID=A0A6U5BLT0_HEMAN|mmetsp:Transcript_56577/g.136818  ORF Transcript_56577/g.136818 Transcript_56577/m.136818 type:complete len:104 (+) Transcript_56577:27-338(+)
MGLLSWFGGAEKAVEKGSADRISERHATQADAVQDYIQSQFEKAYHDGIKVKITEKCFEKCFSLNNYDKKLDPADNQCPALCCDRYLDTMEQVRRVLAQRNRR